MNKFVIFTTLLVLLLGCATNIANIKIEEGKGVLIAKSDSIGSDFMQLGATKSTYIKTIDGKSAADWFDSYEVIPLDAGTYEASVHCSIIQGGLKVKGTSIHTVNVEVGKKYIFTAALLKHNSCITTLEVI